MLKWQFDIIHVPGKIHMGPDTLSRQETTVALVNMLPTGSNDTTEWDSTAEFEAEMAAQAARPAASSSAAGTPPPAGPTPGGQWPPPLVVPAAPWRRRPHATSRGACGGTQCCVSQWPCGWCGRHRSHAAWRLERTPPSERGRDDEEAHLGRAAEAPLARPLRRCVHVARGAALRHAAAHVHLLLHLEQQLAAAGDPRLATPHPTRQRSMTEQAAVRCVRRWATRSVRWSRSSWRVPQRKKLQRRTCSG